MASESQDKNPAQVNAKELARFLESSISVDILRKLAKVFPFPKLFLLSVFRTIPLTFLLGQANRNPLLQVLTAPGAFLLITVSSENSELLEPDVNVKLFTSLQEKFMMPGLVLSSSFEFLKLKKKFFFLLQKFFFRSCVILK